MLYHSDDRRRVAFMTTAEILTGSPILSRAAPTSATSLLEAKSAGRRESFHRRTTSSNKSGHQGFRCNFGKGGWLAAYSSGLDEGVHSLSLQEQRTMAAEFASHHRP